MRRSFGRYRHCKQNVAVCTTKNFRSTVQMWKKWQKQMTTTPSPHGQEAKFCNSAFVPLLQAALFASCFLPWALQSTWTWKRKCFYGSSNGGPGHSTNVLSRLRERALCGNNFRNIETNYSWPICISSPYCLKLKNWRLGDMFSQEIYFISVQPCRTY